MLDDFKEFRNHLYYKINKPIVIKKSKIRVSLFIEPILSNIEMAVSLGADCVELHTGNFCNSYNKKTNRTRDVAYYKI